MNIVESNHEIASGGTNREFMGNASAAVQHKELPDRPMDCSVAARAPLAEKPFNLNSLLAVGEVLLVSTNDYKSLQLPSGFWAAEHSVLSPTVRQQIEKDFDW